MNCYQKDAFLTFFLQLLKNKRMKEIAHKTPTPPPGML